MTSLRQLIRCRLASSSSGQPAMNIWSFRGSCGIRSYSAVIARFSGVSWLARTVSSAVLWVAGASVNASVNTCLMTASTSGMSNGTGPAYSPTTTGLAYPWARIIRRAVSMRAGAVAGSPYRCTSNRSNASRPSDTRWSKNRRGSPSSPSLKTS